MDEKLSKLINYLLIELDSNLRQMYVAEANKPKYTGWKRFLLDMGMDEEKVLEEKRRVTVHKEYSIKASYTGGKVTETINHILDRLEEQGYDRSDVQERLLSIADKYHRRHGSITKLPPTQANELVSNIVTDVRSVLMSL